MDETNLLQPPATSSRQLTWEPSRAEYVGEVSSTRGFGRVYADACDEGLTLVSATTGHSVVLVVTHEERDTVENETLFWLLEPVRTAQVKAPFRVRLFND
jgi:hypothetical protein